MSRRGPAAVVRWLDAVGLVLCLAVGVTLGLGYLATGVRPTDAAIFWDAGQSATIYGEVWSANAGYVYPPVLAQLLGPLPWPLFLVAWMVLVFACLWYALRWLTLPVLFLAPLGWLVVGGPSILSSVVALATVGNPQSIIAALVVLGLRHPAAWAGVIVTKIGPGIGVLWFAFRREWRSLAIALGVTAAIAAVSFALSPSAWGDFLRFALNNYDAPSPVAVVPVPLYLRIPMSLGLLAWGARTDRPWTVPVAAGWAALALYEWSYLTLWLAAIPLAVTPRLAGRQPDDASIVGLGDTSS